jgi:hypothetical protein
MAGNGSKIILYSQPNIYGRRFRCSKRTAAHLDHTKKELRKKAERDKKTYTLRIIQGCYNTGVAASAGTHDFDAVLDVQIVGMDWYEAQRFLRKLGWAAWVRVPPTFSYHIHMISLPPYKLQFVQKVGIYVPGQVDSYYDHTSGLVGDAPDNTWHPDNIRVTIFNYEAYVKSLSAAERMRNLAKRIADLEASYDAAKRQYERFSKAA